jgi:hypothetical protein
MVRSAALNTFHIARNGSQADVPEFEKVATSELLCATLAAEQKMQAQNWLPSSTEVPDKLYPIRDHPRPALELIQRRSQD